MKRASAVRWIAVACLGLMVSGCVGSREGAVPTVAAAASLRHVMPALLEGFGQQVRVTYGASGTLRQQVEGGAPVDVVLFAAATPVDQLIARGHADAATRRRLASNDLVLVGPSGGPAVTWASLTELPEGERLAMGTPGAVPAGRYAREALEQLGSWEVLQPRVVFGGDVAAVLASARRGEVAVAAVYATDARGQDDLVVLDRADWEGAPSPEVIGAAVTDHAGGRALLTWLASDEARARFDAFGFGPP